MSRGNSDRGDWVIDAEIAVAQHLPTGVVFRYLPVPNHPEQLRTFVITAHGEYANGYNHAAQSLVKRLGEQGKVYYLDELDGERHN